MECTDLLSVIFLNYKIMNIALDFNKGDHVVAKLLGDWVEGYIVGFKYTDHCYLEKPSILYAILIAEHYEDNKESIDNNESPFHFYLHWKTTEEIILIN